MIRVRLTNPSPNSPQPAREQIEHNAGAPIGGSGRITCVSEERTECSEAGFLQYMWCTRRHIVSWVKAIRSQS
jgi:hypothetical protein